MMRFFKRPTGVVLLLGNRMDVGVSIFHPRRNYRTFNEGSKGGNGTFTYQSKINMSSAGDYSDLFAKGGAIGIPPGSEWV